VQVVDLDIYRRTTPDKLTKASLQRILALNDRLAITRLVGIDRDARNTLFELPPAELTSLARSLTEDELATLARYLTGLRKEPRERVLRAVAADPTKMQSLASERVRIAVVASADQTAAVTMMLRQDATLNPKAIVEDVGLVTGRRVSPILLWEKHPVVIVAGLVVVLILLLMLRRLLFAGRRTKQAA